ncbi:MAG: signal peptidase II [Elusimicrobiota bacterium]
MFNKEFFKVGIVIFVFIADRVSKNLILNFPEYNFHWIIPGVVSINFIHNSGVAFGLLKGYNLFFIFFNTLLLGFLLLIRKKFSDFLSSLAIHFIIGGALGNIFDRIKYGYVIDFIDLKYFPAIFNIADFSITCGAVLLVYLSIKEAREVKCSQ